MKINIRHPGEGRDPCNGKVAQKAAEKLARLEFLFWPFVFFIGSAWVPAFAGMTDYKNRIKL